MASLRSTPALVLFLAVVSAVLVTAQVTPPLPADSGELPLTPPETPEPPADVTIPIIPDLPGIGIPGKGFGSGSGRRAKCESCKASCRRKRGLVRIVCNGVCKIQCKLNLSGEVFSCTEDCAFSVNPTSFTDAYEVNDHINSCYESCKI